MRKLLIRLTHWEYWPFLVLYFPVFFYYLWLAFKHRSFFFFTASNPSIDFGGMVGEKKSDIFNLLPAEFIPETALINRGDVFSAKKEAETIGYPVIAKPNIGERGVWVSKISNQEELEKYTSNCPVDFLLQELIDYPIELGVFYVKFPNEEKGKITSIVRKNFLSVKGDGKRTVNQLLRKSDRAVLTADMESDFLKEIGDTIPLEGREVLVEPIGNHCRGTQFLNDNDKINHELDEALDRLAGQIADFYFGRFDLRCKSYEDLSQLRNFKILELNGAGSEPGHIYQPGYPLLKAYKDILRHLCVLADISAQNKRRGIVYWSFQKGYKRWIAYSKYKRLLSS
ncbi:MAG: hypothetical protein AAF600_11505 [Bacteroidota bacterium]